MIFGSAVLGADVLTIPDAPTDIKNIYYSRIHGAYFDDFYFTEDVEYTLTENVPMEWDEYTILHAKYDNGLGAGTVDFRFDDIAGGYLCVKRKSIFGDRWITLHAYYIRKNTQEHIPTQDAPITVRHFYDCINEFVDYTCCPGIEYTYALVPEYPEIVMDEYNPDEEEFVDEGDAAPNLTDDNLIDEGTWVVNTSSTIHNMTIYGPATNIYINYTPMLYVRQGLRLVEVTFNEGNYYISKITPMTDRLVICSHDTLYATIYTDGNCDNQRNIGPGVFNTLNGKYPTFVDNTLANYETVNVTGEFYKSDEESCGYDDSVEAAPYNMLHSKKFKDFLMNRKPKFLKNIDGRVWFCYVTTPPSDNARDNYWTREVTFGVTEFADIEDEEYLYDAKFITAPKEWWNR